MLARWLSPIILHYVKLASLQGVTSAVAALQSRRSLDEILARFSDSSLEVGSLRTLVGEYSAAHLADEQALRARVDALEVLVDPHYIVSVPTAANKVKGPKWHKKNPESTLACTEWRTQCGWAYGVEEFVRGLVLPDDSKLHCRRCFR